MLQKLGGAVPSPFDCWLLLRGIRTLPWRVRAHCDNAGLVASFLAVAPEGGGGALPRPGERTPVTRSRDGR